MRKASESISSQRDEVSFHDVRERWFGPVNRAPRRVTFSGHKKEGAVEGRGGGGHPNDCRQAPADEALAVGKIIKGLCFQVPSNQPALKSFLDRACVRWYRRRPKKTWFRLGWRILRNRPIMEGMEEEIYRFNATNAITTTYAHQRAGRQRTSRRKLRSWRLSSVWESLLFTFHSMPCSGAGVGFAAGLLP